MGLKEKPGGPLKSLLDVCSEYLTPGSLLSSLITYVVVESLGC